MQSSGISLHSELVQSIRACSELVQYLDEAWGFGAVVVHAAWGIDVNPWQNRYLALWTFCSQVVASSSGTFATPRVASIGASKQCRIRILLEPWKIGDCFSILVVPGQPARTLRIENEQVQLFGRTGG